MLDLRVRIGCLELKNPVLLASGTCGYGTELSGFFDICRLGGLMLKGITLKPRPGNPPPRIWETPAGMLNSIGLENVGVDAFIEEKLPPLRDAGVTAIANINGETVEDYAELARRLDGVDGVHALEVNVSCPNVKRGGIEFGRDPAGVAQVTRAVRQATRLPILVKLSPNVADIAEMALAAEKAGADGLSLINTLVGMAIDVRTRRPRLATVTGGLSGPAIRPVAVRMVWEAYRAVSIPIVGMGGIATAEDALEFLIAGATAVAVGTAIFIDPSAACGVLKGICAFMEENGIESVEELIGSVRVDRDEG